jgi:hypothetical protein
LIALREVLSEAWEPLNLRAIVGGIAFSRLHRGKGKKGFGNKDTQASYRPAGGVE